MNFKQIDIFVKCFLIFVCLFSQKKICAQDFSKTMASEWGVRFYKPKGFSLINNNDSPFLQYEYITKDGRKVPHLPDFYLDNEDSSIRILVGTFNYSDRQPDIFNPYYIDEHMVAYYHVVNQADTVKGSIEYEPAKKLNKTNSNFISKFSFDFGMPNTLGEYKYNKCVLYNKYNQVFIQAVYLFKESSKHLMHEIVHDTRYMFTFEDKPFVNPESINNLLEKHYIRHDQIYSTDTLDRLWNKGKIYNNLYYFWEEHLAIKHKTNVIISVVFPKNNLWPYHNSINDKKIDTTSNIDKWQRANDDFKKYLSLAKDIPVKCSTEETRQLNADEAYLFDFSYDKGDEYRNKYRDCRVLLIHKRNVGSVIIKYYYKPKGRVKIDNIIKSTFGKIGFKDSAFFNQLGNKVYPY